MVTDPPACKHCTRNNPDIHGHIVESRKLARGADPVLTGCEAGKQTQRERERERDMGDGGRESLGEG